MKKKHQIVTILSIFVLFICLNFKGLSVRDHDIELEDITPYGLEWDNPDDD